MALIGLIQDLYAANKDNQTFLHTRFALSQNVLEPYKKTLERWLWPNVLRKQDTSVAKAKEVIASYQKAVGEPTGLAELLVYYCEMAAGFSEEVGNDEKVYLDTLVRMFAQAVQVVEQLPESDRPDLIARLNDVREISHNIGYSVGEDMDDIMGNSSLDVE